MHEKISWIFQLIESRFLMWIRKKTLHFFSTNFYILNLHDYCRHSKFYSAFDLHCWWTLKKIHDWFKAKGDLGLLQQNRRGRKLQMQYMHRWNFVSTSKYNQCCYSFETFRNPYRNDAFENRQRESTDLTLKHTALKILTMYKLNKKLQSTTKTATVIKNYVNTLQAC